MKKFLKGKKTKIVAGLTVAISVINMLSGDITFQEVLASEHLKILLAGVFAYTFRDAIK